MEKRLVKNIPKETRVAVLSEIQQYAVSLLGVIVSPEGLNARPIGSGTLCRIDNQPAILTAGHVIKNKSWDLKSGRDCTHLGIAFRKNEECFKIKIDSLCVVGKWNLEQSPSNSDWAIIFLPPDSIGYLVASMKFVSLPSPGDQFPIQQFRERLAVLVGTPGAWCEEAIDPHMDHQGWNLGSLCGFGGVTNVLKSDGRRILEFDAVMKEDYCGPTDFRGISGGALWLVDLEEKESGIAIARMQLAGVPFWQQPIAGSDTTAILCQDILEIMTDYASR